MSISAKAIGCVFLRSLTMPAFFVIRHFSPRPLSHTTSSSLAIRIRYEGGGFQGLLLCFANMTSCSSPKRNNKTLMRVTYAQEWRGPRRRRFAVSKKRTHIRPQY